MHVLRSLPLLVAIGLLVMSIPFMVFPNTCLQENPEAKLEDLEKPGVDEEPQQVLLRCVSHGHYLKYPIIALYGRHW